MSSVLKSTLRTINVIRYVDDIEIIDNGLKDVDFICLNNLDIMYNQM